MIKKTCLISRMRRICEMKEKKVKLCVCITMYNENEKELKDTLTGVVQNYNVLHMDGELKQEDILVVLVCDGFERIPESFKKYATEH